MYRVLLHPGCRRDAEPHGFGVLESITVFRGNVTVEIGGDSYSLQPGDALSFSADMPHVYQNTGDTMCEISMAVIYQSGPQKSV
jgi:quercetin dioxygenase-like cupin family protein